MDSTEIKPNSEVLILLLVQILCGTDLSSPVASASLPSSFTARQPPWPFNHPPPPPPNQVNRDAPGLHLEALWFIY